LNTIKPIKIGSHKSSPNEPLTSAEVAKLWATYMGNSMSRCILSYYLQHVEDEDIKALLKNALHLSDVFLETTKEIFKKDKIPFPVGFTEKDVNLNAPKLFEDEFYVHYLKYAAKAGLSIYQIAIPLVYREDVRDFFVYCMDATMQLMEQIKMILLRKGFIKKPPLIPVQDRPEFANENFLNGYIGKVRPLHAMEITHLYDNIENNVTSKALILAFGQVARQEKVKSLFIRGKEMTHKNVERYKLLLHEENLPSPEYLDHLITTSTFAPFSDKLMLFHKVDMFSMKIRAFGNSLAVNGRHDIGVMYTKSLMNIMMFVTNGAKIMMENGWMEEPPHAVNRDDLAKP